MGTADPVGQRDGQRRRAAPGKQRLEPRRDVGRGGDAGRRCRRLGRELRRQHRLEHHRREHRLEYHDDNIVWSTNDDNIVWSTSDADNIVWSTTYMENVVWGTDCGGANCRRRLWGATAEDGSAGAPPSSGQHRLEHQR